MNNSNTSIAKRQTTLTFDGPLRKLTSAVVTISDDDDDMNPPKGLPPHASTSYLKESSTVEPKKSLSLSRNSSISIFERQK